MINTQPETEAKFSAPPPRGVSDATVGCVISGKNRKDKTATNRWRQQPQGQAAGTETASEQRQHQQHQLHHSQSLPLHQHESSSLSLMSPSSTSSMDLLLQNSQHQHAQQQRQPLSQGRHQSFGKIGSMGVAHNGPGGGRRGGGGRGMSLAGCPGSSRVIKGGTRGLYAQVGAELFRLRFK